MKKDEVMNLLTEYATNERLDKLILQNTEYVEARGTADRLLDELEGIDSSNQAHELIDRYDSALAVVSALYSKLSYQQGLKDMFNLIMSLQNRGIDIENEDL